MKLELVVERREVVPGCGLWMEITREGTLHETIERFLRRKATIGNLRGETKEYRKEKVT